jgi:hypothetical protein
MSKTDIIVPQYENALSYTEWLKIQLSKNGKHLRFELNLCKLYRIFLNMCIKYLLSSIDLLHRKIFSILYFKYRHVYIHIISFSRVLNDVTIELVKFTKLPLKFPNLNLLEYYFRAHFNS